MSNKELYIKGIKRTFVSFNDKEKLAYILQKHLSNKKFFVKGKKEITVVIQFISDENLLELNFSESISLELFHTKYLTVYTLTKHYIEISLKKISLNSNGKKGNFDFLEAKIANNRREFPRISSNEVIYLKNIQLRRYSIDPNMRDLPLCVKIALNHIKPEIIQKIPDCKVETFNFSKLQAKLLQVVHKTQKILYIPNLTDESTYIYADEFIDIKTHFGEQWNQEKKLIQEQSIQFLLIYPIIYENLSSEKVLIGYFKITSSSNVTYDIQEEVLPLFKKFSSIVNDHICRSNMILLPGEYLPFNMSVSGIRFCIQEKKLIDMLLFNSKGRIFFEVYINSKKRFVLYGELISIFQELENSKPKEVYWISLFIKGSKQKIGRKSWKEYIESFFNVLS